jgi:hypothetical protein
MTAKNASVPIASDALNRLENLREQMYQLFRLHGNLCHPDVVKASQWLDEAIAEIQRSKRNVIEDE